MHSPTFNRRCGSAHCCEPGSTFLIPEGVAPGEHEELPPLTVAMIVNTWGLPRPACWTWTGGFAENLPDTPDYWGSSVHCAGKVLPRVILMTNDLGVFRR